MKINKFIVFIISIVFIIGITFTSFASDIDDPGSGDDTSSQTPADNNDNNNNNENNNDNNNQNNNNNDNNTTNEVNSNNQNSNPGQNNNQNEEPTQNENSTDNQNNNNGQTEALNPNASTHSNENKPPITYNNNSYTQTNTQTQEKSDNANLKSLTVDVEGLTPEYNKNITDYYLIVDLSIESINVEAATEDVNATYYISGNEEITQGQNTIKIVVTAENGTTKTYNIYVTKTDNIELTNANLKSLKISVWDMYPSFKPNIYNYSLTINEKITNLDINVETENEEATFEIEGNDNLTEGDNLIKIIVTAPDGETKREYKINAYIVSKVINEKNESKLPAIILFAVLGTAIIVITSALIKKK